MRLRKNISTTNRVSGLTGEVRPDTSPISGAGRTVTLLTSQAHVPTTEFNSTLPLHPNQFGTTKTRSNRQGDSSLERQEGK